MNVVIAEFREQDVAHDNRFFASGRPAGQAKKRAPITFMHNSVADQIIILTMVKQRHANHARVFHSAPHEFVILNAATVIRYRHDASLCQ